MDYHDVQPDMKGYYYSLLIIITLKITNIPLDWSWFQHFLELLTVVVVSQSLIVLKGLCCWIETY